MKSSSKVPPQILVFAALFDNFCTAADDAAQKYQVRRQKLIEASNASIAHAEAKLASQSPGERCAYTQHVHNSLPRQIKILIEGSPGCNYGTTTYINSHTHCTVHLGEGCRIRVHGGGTYSANYENEIVIP